MHTDRRRLFSKLRLNLEHIHNFVEKFYPAMSRKGTRFTGPQSNLPLNGIYIFFERGQKITINSGEHSRIVRVGINEKPNNFRKRISGHYRGNIEASVFRENVGWSLLETQGQRPRLNYRTKKAYKKHNSGGALEKQISRYFAENLIFKAFNLDHGDLALYERILLAALSLYYQQRIRNNTMTFGSWLGLNSHSRGDRIRKSGLWNSKEVVLLDHLVSDRKKAEFIQQINETQLELILNDMIDNIV